MRIALLFLCPALLFAQTWHITLHNQTTTDLTLSLYPESVQSTLPKTLSSTQSATGTLDANYATVAFYSPDMGIGRIFLTLSSFTPPEIRKCQYGYQCSLNKQDNTHFSITFIKKTKN